MCSLARASNTCLPKPTTAATIMAELNEALRGCSNTAAGDDGIHYAVIKLISDNSMYLLDLYDKIWTEVAFPSLWRVAIVLPFLKPGKDALVWVN